MLSDLAIAQAAQLQPIADVAANYSLSADDLDFYGKHKAKVHLDALKKFSDRQIGRASCRERVYSSV